MSVTAMLALGGLGLGVLFGVYKLFAPTTYAIDDSRDHSGDTPTNDCDGGDGGGD